jgi:hypothetical protein
MSEYVEPDPFENDIEPVYSDEYEDDAENQILALIKENHVVTDRELKVRLESSFFPWLTERSLLKLVVKGEVKKYLLPGRKPKMGTPNTFYADPDYDRYDREALMRRKRDLTRDINAILTRQSPAGEHAEILFEKAFRSIGCKILKKNASEFNGIKVQGIEGKQPPNLDFILKKSNKIYGVDIKNWLQYEFVTIREVVKKVDIAEQLGIIPIIIARYVDRDTIYTKIIAKGGRCYPYQQLLIPPSYISLADELNRYMGYKVLAVDELPSYKIEHIKTKIII